MNGREQSNQASGVAALWSIATALGVIAGLLALFLMIIA